MGKTRTLCISFLMLSMLLIQPLAAATSTASEAKQEWFDAKEKSSETQEAHREAKVAWASDKTNENKQAVIDTGKDALHAALDEAQAWLIWKDLETEENPEIPDELKETIHEDVEANLQTIEELREDVDAIHNELDMGIVYLKMAGKYIELLTDVARNSGNIWVHIANTKADTVEEYEVTLRKAAESIEENEIIIEKLDLAKTELENARENIDNAEAEYDQVALPGTPLVKFSNGNNYLRIARGNLISAHGHLNQAYNLMVTGGE
ncbi:hypothetical protein V7O62_12915 [Methanolobus sp. ZRKC2]|uniref:hypothetical protein n=1 Tax=Methanolobus sp. ZRKC2 TaxID=3125783 RepID=UPI0032496B31